MKNIIFYCICGISYNSYIGNGKYSFGAYSNDYRFHKCPKCNHIWDLRPDLPKPTNIEVREGIPNVATIIGNI